jgi:hypothetical protein
MYKVRQSEKNVLSGTALTPIMKALSSFVTSGPTHPAIASHPRQLESSLALM